MADSPQRALNTLMAGIFLDHASACFNLIFPAKLPSAFCGVNPSSVIGRSVTKELGQRG